MTAYHGGKQRIGKKLAKIIVDESIGIEEDYDFDIKGYCEPFCGMLGVYKHIPNLFETEGYTKLKYKAGDTNISVIKMWKATQNGWKPPTRLISKREFLKLKGNGNSSADKGFIGHQYGYMGKYFQPFDARQSLTKRNNASQKVSQIGKNLLDVKFFPCSYKIFSKLKGFVIYCDPPYLQGSCYYDETGKILPRFEHADFWNWCRIMAKDNIIFVSEYKAPKDFIKVWKGMSRTPGKSKQEKLFMIV